jgi:cytochrome c
MQVERARPAHPVVRKWVPFVAGLACLLASVLALRANAAESAALAGDATRGKALFSICAGCHDLTSTAKPGPPLQGVVGRKAGSVPGAHYSPAMAKAALIWTAPELDRYLASPTTVVPESRMGIRITDAQKRADLIAYLTTLGH